MARLTAEQQETITAEVQSQVTRSLAEAGSRRLLIQLRRGYYQGTIHPDIERGHDYISTEWSKTIAKKMAAYFMANGLSVKVKSPDVSDEELNTASTIANALADEKYNKSAYFQNLLLELAEYSSKDGDAFISTTIENGDPRHYLIIDPSYIGVLFRDDSFKDIDFWSYARGLNVDYIKKQFDIETSPAPQRLLNFNSGTVNTHNNPYGVPNSNQASPNYVAGDARSNMAEYTVANDILNGKKTQLINGKAYFQDEDPMPLYHFAANIDPGRPWGLSDFESSAQLIMKLEEKISEESDVVSQGSHQKLITDQNPEEIARSWKPNRTQAFKIPRRGNDGSGYLEILKTNDNVVNNEQFLNTLLNLIRTNSGLQELGQDQIAANVSGRAIQYMFQGVQQIVKMKRTRLNEMLTRMVIDDFRYMAEGDKMLKSALFDSDDNFKLRIDIKYPPVLEQDEQIRISNIQTMRQGKVPLMSDFTARTLLSDYIDDPNEEQKRVDLETQKSMQDQIKMEQELKATQQQPQTQQPQVVQPQGMEPANSTEAAGVVSSQGEPGSAQQAGVSPAGFQDQQLQQQGITG